MNQEVARYMLEERGYLVDVAATGREVLEVLERCTYAAILMDIQMPELDGFAATVAIRQREREGQDRHTPIIALTANALRGEREKCLAAGMDDYLSKPIVPSELDKILRHWVAGDQPAPEPPATEAVTDAAPDDSDGSLDPVTLASLRKLQRASGKQILPQLVALFSNLTPAKLGVLSAAITAGDAQTVYQQAHALKGSSANIGASRLAQLCGALEGLGEAGNMAGAADLLAAIDVEFERARRALAIAQAKE